MSDFVQVSHDNRDTKQVDSSGNISDLFPGGKLFKSWEQKPDFLIEIFRIFSQSRLPHAFQFLIHYHAIIR
jgi:hypothetical protein